MSTAGLTALVVDTLREFLEVAIHVILLNLHVYPDEAFERVDAYNTKVKRCRHPKVKEYIGNALLKLQPLLSQGTVTEVAVVLLNQDQKIAKSVVLHLERLVVNPVPNQVDWEALRAAFQSTLTNLQFIDIHGKRLPDGSPWSLDVYCTRREGLDMTYWEDCTAQHNTASQQQQQQTGPPQRRLPTATVVKTLDVPGLLRMQVLVEEPAA